LRRKQREGGEGGREEEEEREEKKGKKGKRKERGCLKEEKAYILQWYFEVVTILCS